jgi:polyhydroxyalkanoate synthesis repressor PhaR
VNDPRFAPPFSGFDATAPGSSPVTSAPESGSVGAKAGGQAGAPSTSEPSGPAVRRPGEGPAFQGSAETAGHPGNPSPAIVLKKYGNRRLYDTSSSRYVTLVEVEQMVQGGADIVVFDAKTGVDITKEVLVQLLLERDDARAALPVGLLKQAVRLAGTPLKDSLSRVMQEGLDRFLTSQRALLDAQRAFQAQVAQVAQMTPLAPLSSLPGTPWNGALPSLWNPFAALTPAPPRAPESTMASAPASVPASAPTSAPTSAPASAPASAPTSASASASGMASTEQLEVLKAELSQTQALVRRLLERQEESSSGPARRRTSKTAEKKTSSSRARKRRS